MMSTVFVTKSHFHFIEMLNVLIYDMAVRNWLLPYMSDD